MATISVNTKILFFILLFICFHFVVETCADFVYIINAATEHIGIFLSREFEVGEQTIAELLFVEVGVLPVHKSDEAWVHTLESRLKTGPMVFAIKERLFQILEGYRIVSVARQHFEAADDVAFL